MKPNGILTKCLAFALVYPIAALAIAAPILYGGLGGHNNGDSTNDGALVTVNQSTGVTTVVGHPAGVARISGLDFGLDGVLLASDLRPGGGFPPPTGPRFSDLITIDPISGALLTTVPILAPGGPLSIADLAVQPSTGVIYGITTPDGAGPPGQLYTISRTGAATLVGDENAFFASIAFAPNGTLYMSAANLGPGAPVQPTLRTLNPANGAGLTSVSTADFFGALAVRPTDGAIFGGTGDSSGLFIVNPATGAETLIGNTGRNFIGDLAFRPNAIPEPATIGLTGLALAALITSRRRNERKDSYDPDRGRL